MKQRRSFSFVEWLKTLVIFIEIVLMLVLMILLMVGQNSTREEALPQADRMVVYASGVQPMLSREMNTARVSPYMLAYRRGGGEAQILHAAEAAEKPYAALYPLLRELLGAGAVAYSPEGKVGAELWAASASLSDYIYVRYVGTLPASVIRAYTYSEESAEAVSSDEYTPGTAAYIRELFFLPVRELRAYEDQITMLRRQNDDDICALSCDDAGNVTLFCLSGTSASQSDASQSDASQNTDAQIPAPAAEDSGQDAAVFSDAQTVSEESSVGSLYTYMDSIAALSVQLHAGTLVPSSGEYGMTASLTGLYSMPRITLTPYDPDVSLYADVQKMTAVFGLLGMSERDTDNYYTDTGGSRVYLNARGRLTVSAEDAVIRYDALQEGGLDLSDYLGYASVGGNYLLSEYLRAADRLLSDLRAQEPAFGGEELVCSLIGVYMTTDGQEGDTLVLTYGYTFRGIPLLDADGEIRRAMVIHARGGTVSHLELYPCHTVLSEEEAYLLPQAIAMEAMMLESSEKGTEAAVPEGLYMAYPLCTDGDITYSADWIGVLP